MRSPFVGLVPEQIRAFSPAQLAAIMRPPPGGLAAIPGIAEAQSFEQRYSSKDYFTYELDFVGAAGNLVGGGAARVLGFQIDAENDFLWQKACYVADIAAAAQTFTTRVVPLVTVLIQVSPSGRALSNNIAVPVTSLFGTGEIPFILPHPRNFPARGQVTVTAQAFVAAGTTYNLRLSFIGTKLYLKNP